MLQSLILTDALVLWFLVIYNDIHCNHWLLCATTLNFIIVSLGTNILTEKCPSDNLVTTWALLYVPANMLVLTMCSFTLYFSIIRLQHDVSLFNILNVICIDMDNSDGIDDVESFLQDKLPPYVVKCFLAAGFDTPDVIASMDTSENPSLEIIESFIAILVIKTSIQPLLHQ